MAKEVRSLARRSADAAKTTASLIEDSRQNSRNGAEVSAEVLAFLDRITSAVEGVDTLVRQVSTAAVEQAQGIGEISRAMSQMDSVNQANAASSEESASASQQLSSQAGEVRRLVLELRHVVHGARDGGGPEAPARWASSAAPDDV